MKVRNRRKYHKISQPKISSPNRIELLKQQVQPENHIGQLPNSDPCLPTRENERRKVSTSQRIYYHEKLFMRRVFL